MGEVVRIGHTNGNFGFEFRELRVYILSVKFYTVGQTESSYIFLFCGHNGNINKMTYYTLVCFCLLFKRYHKSILLNVHSTASQKSPTF